jgi:hypothetical protein
VCPLDDPNAVFKMLLFNFMAVTFPSTKEGDELRSADSNLELIKTLKCTLYSHDIKLHTIQNVSLDLDDT